MHLWAADGLGKAQPLVEKKLTRLWRAGVCMILYVCLSKQARDAQSVGSQQYFCELAQQALRREKVSLAAQPQALQAKAKP